jgi:hypothetical protein
MDFFVSEAPPFGATVERPDAEPTGMVALDAPRRRRRGNTNNLSVAINNSIAFAW